MNERSNVGSNTNIIKIVCMGALNC